MSEPTLHSLKAVFTLPASEHRLELRHLRYFKAVAEELSFTRAAEKLHMAQPPLSQQIKQLEDELNVKLLERDTRPIRLTEAGEQFLLRVNSILADIHNRIRDVKGIAEGRNGRLAIGFAGSAMYNGLPEVLGLFQQCCPGVELAFKEMLAAEITPALLTRSIDIGFARPPINENPAIHQKLLLNEPLVAAVPAWHRLAGRGRISVTDLHGEKVVLYPRYPLPSLTDLILNTLDAASVRVHIVQQIENLQAALGLTRAGVGLTFVPQSVGAEQRQGIVFLPIEGDLLRSPMSAAWLTENCTAAVHNLLPMLDLAGTWLQAQRPPATGTIAPVT
ncbi:LysR family transcriptional regulator [Xanthomonas hyacinthi]|uniref:LysR family transcriptional regulator n=1 Tax=Xanthomonas hyacinthi TaxID=56455 RepID=A0A2S7EPZ4_9XANT|nr:LysR family transcriptional regulator [Xanthomonas hyacinthi]PPU95192.1 LysR family transcriptional regulator [Xanthomonas hyacinthi]QGY78964.1 LysR family transcriptional regulator [Xanthomonas hyacinthi]